MDTKSVFTKTFSKKTEPTKSAPVPKNEKPKKEKQPQPASGVGQGSRRQARAAAAVSRTVVTETFDSEHIVRSIHQQKEELQRITVDMPKDIYLQMKVHLAHENVSIRDFIVRLVDVYLTKNNIR